MNLRHLHRPQSVISLGTNLAPMIDITFLLITFFMLAGHLASAEKVEMKLPNPDHSQAVDRKFPDRVVINLIFEGPGRPPGMTSGTMTLASIDDLSNRLGEAARQNPQVRVILRADRRLPYGRVREVMELVASHQLRRLQVVTELR